jgi:GrpB-like predicted nucleotidyltransferase (UPF0157 family)
VKIVSYDPNWPEAFEHEKTLLLSRIGDLVLDIQHVGSTAVFGLDAKPIIDIAVAVESIQLISELRPSLHSLGYIDRGDSGDNGGYLFIKEVAPEIRSHHLHIVAIDDQQWHNYLLFRDTLRSDQELHGKYAELKKSLEQRFARDRQGYTQAKHHFIRRVLQSETKV